MDVGETLVDRLHLAAARDPAAPALRFLGDGTAVTESLSYGQLLARACGVAAELTLRGLAGRPVLLIYPPGLEFVVALFGCFVARVIAVPVPYLVPKRSWERIIAITANADPAALLTLERIIIDESALRQFERPRPWIGTDQLPDAPGPAELPTSRDIALLQYTSGSTGDPKGVVITHRNLMHNQAAMARAFAHETEFVGVSWLPAYHDMGLIGGILHPIYNQAQTILLPPLLVLQRPLRWLEAIHRFRGSISPAPSFGYQLATRRVAPDALSGLDLSCWKVAICGGEPVNAAAVSAFIDRFAPHGFAASSFMPAYGLAEATLLVSAGHSKPSPRILDLDSAALASHRAEAARPGCPTSTMVSCGQPDPSFIVAIVDPETTGVLPGGKIGEIWVSGDSVGEGYWRREQDNPAYFGGSLAGHPGVAFLRTGDLGFCVDSDLFVAGRLNDLIIIRGQNFHPQDLEHTLYASHHALEDGFAAAFGTPTADGEALVIICEASRDAAAAVGPTVAKVAIAAIAGKFGLRLHNLLLVRPGTLPRTTSGKVRRARARVLYLEGAFASAVLEPSQHRLSGQDSG